MRGRSARSWIAPPPLAHVAALVAVALLTLAGVRATVMQADEARGAAAPCTMAGMAGMAGMDAPRQAGRDSPHGKAHAACEFCAAAAHAPLSTHAPVLRQPSAVAWFAPPPVAALGPRGPPAFRARARAPPTLPTA